LTGILRTDTKTLKEQGN